jgi:octaprenyl-diphosphate synthase
MILFESIKTELDQVHGCLAELIQSGDPLLDPCLKELAERRGKMLRPALVLLFAKTVSQVRPIHIHLAAVVELIHTASLLHDDVIDQAGIRRGRPTANILWGNTAAVLLGDFLLSRAFSLMTQAPREAVSLLCRTAEILCTGELKQNLLRGRPELTEQDYFSIIEAKTAALFSCCCRLGTMASDGNSLQIEAAGNYGRHFGIAFQIMDDLTDIRSTSQLAGKTLGTDFLHEKRTLSVIHWLNQDPLLKNARVQQLAGLTSDDLMKILRDSGSIDYAFSLAKEHSRQALTQLSVFAESEARKNLAALTEQILFPSL